MHSFLSIIPIFVVIFLGFLGKKIGLITQSFTRPANSVVFYFAIPALLFLNISKTNFNLAFRIKAIAVVISALILAWIIMYAVGKILRISSGTFGTFLQASTQGNIGYFALSVAFYTLGHNGLILTGVIGSFLIIGQNILSITSLSFFNNRPQKGAFGIKPLLSIIKNPIIISSVAALLFSYEEWQIPIIVGRTLAILSGMALPVALLVIGANLSVKELSHPKLVLFTAAGKLLLLPAIGIIATKIFGIDDKLTSEVILILLSSPSATVTITMALEMEGNAKLAAAAVTVATFFSIFTYPIWL